MSAAGLSYLIAEQSGPLCGRIEVPGDKSISHRALILGALAEGQTRIEGLLESSDVLHTARAIELFGARAKRSREGVWLVDGAAWRSPEQAIDCGNSGTAARLLMGAAAGFPIEVTFTGDASLQQRPMGRVLDPLRAMGARAEACDRLPLTLRGGDLGGIRYHNIYASAQIKSAVLLAGLRAGGGVEVSEPRPTRDHTEQMLRQFGCDVETIDTKAERTVRLGSRRRLRASHAIVPGDPSSAAFPLVAALITSGSELTVTSMLDSSLRTGLLTTLVAMGAKLELHRRRRVGGMSVADVTARSSKLTGIVVPASKAPSMIDEYPLLAVAAAFARGRTIMHGLAELRVKESDRLAAILNGLRASGVRASIDGDSLIIDGCGGPPPGGATVDALGDHRVAMSFLTLGLGAREPVAVDSAEMISTSFPGFATLMHSIGANIAPPIAPTTTAEQDARHSKRAMS